MFKLLDFLVLATVITAVQFWSDGNKVHMWTLVGLVVATNLIAYFRGLKA